MGGESLGELLPEIIVAEPYGEGDTETDQGRKYDVEVFDRDVLPDSTTRDLVSVELVIHHGYEAEVLGRYACIVAGKTGEFGECLDGMFDCAVDESLCVWRRVICMIDITLNMALVLTSNSASGRL